MNQRYDRQAKLSEIGKTGQAKIQRGQVLVVGMGGLGCASAPWLVRAGVGRIVVLDPDIVNLPDLGRQLLYADGDVGESKSEVSATAMRRMNPEVQVEGLPLALTSENISILSRGMDVIVDGTDSVVPRMAMNAYSVKTRTPVVFGGAVGWAGMVLTVAPGMPCRECAFSDSPTAAVCSEAGVIGPAVGWVGAMQAAETLRILLGHQIRGGSLQTVDLLNGTSRRLKVRKNPCCPVCGTRPD